jgi:hypothetical protein
VPTDVKSASEDGNLWEPVTESKVSLERPAQVPADRCGCRVCCGGPEAASRAGGSVPLEMKLDDLRATCGQRAGSMLLVKRHRSTWREPALAPRPAAQNMITPDARSQTGTVVPGSVGLLDPLGELLQSEPVRH